MSDIFHDPELEEMWKEAEFECRKSIGSQWQASLSVEDILKKLEDSKTKDEAYAHTKRGKAKEILQTTLVCINTLGGIAAQGASMVFGPSQMCFNAVSFLIQTTQNYSKIFAGMIVLFERISVFLDRFRIYTETASVDQRLKRLIQQLLQSFMRICNISLKLVKSNKVLLYTKVFFFNTDEGVKGELSKLESLVRDEVSMSVALILQSAKFTEGAVLELQIEVHEVGQALGGKLDGVAFQVEDIHALVERGEKESKTKQITETNRSTVKKVLAISEKESWIAEQGNYVGGLIDETGNWLVQRNTDFISWARAEPKAKPAFAIEGQDGFGKSHLFSAVVRHLFGLHTSQVSDRRVAIAYFFIQNDRPEKQDVKDRNIAPDKRGDSLDVALKSIIWQLTTKDAGYQKSVATACRSPEELGGIEDIWNRLVIELSNIDATFFVLLDGIENISSERGQRLQRIMHRTMARKNSKLRVQWFVTGSPSAFAYGGAVGLEESPLVTKLALGACNRDDLLRFTDTKMDTMKALASKSDPEISKLRTTIRERLIDGVAGDFTKLEYKLRDISTRTRKDEIEEVLTHVAEDIGAMVIRQLDRLNQDLDEKDVDDLNDLLTWIAAIESVGSWYSKISLLDEMLALKANSRSLIPLLERIKTSFAPLLETSENTFSDDHLVMIAPSFLEHFKSSQGAGAVATSGYSSVLHHSEIAIVERFLKTVCDEDLFRRFEFEKYFRQKSGKKKATIHVDIESVHVNMVTYLLKAICNSENPTRTHVLKYAANCLPSHLTDDKWTKADQQSKKFAGSLLFRILTDEDVITKLWAGHIWELGYNWILEDEFVKNVLAWLKDPATTQDISDQQRVWIAGLTSNSALRNDLLKETLLVMARRCLRCPTWEIIDEYEVVISFQIKIEKCARGATEVDYEDLFGAPSVATILKAEAWAQNELKIDRPDSLWQTQMSYIFCHYKFAPEALERGLNALQLEPNSWRARYSVALAHEIAGPSRYFESAVDQMTMVAKVFREDSALADKETETFYRILMSLGKCKTELRQYDSAMEVLREVCEKYPDKNDAILSTLNCLNAQEKFSEIVQYLEDLNNKINEEGLSKLIAFYHRLSGDDHLKFHEFVLSSLKGTLCIPFVRETFQVAIEAANSDGEKLSTAMDLRYWHAHTLYHIAEFDHDYEEALQIWEQNLTPVPHPTIRLRQWQTMQRIAPAYLQRAIKLGPDNPSTPKLVVRLKDLLKKSTQRGLGTADIRFQVARGCNLVGDQEEARDSMRGDIRMALDLLSDDDPSNDWQGYMALARVLTQLNDDKNALAAWSLTHFPRDINDAEIVTDAPSEEQLLPLEENQDTTAGADRRDGAQVCKTGTDEQSCTSIDAPTMVGTPDSESPSNSIDADQFDFYYVCDGDRGRKWVSPDDLYYCKDCIEVQFDEGCYLKLKEGNLEVKADCDPSHDFLYIPKRGTAAHDTRPPDSVVVGEDTMLVKDWLNGIRKEWSLGNVEA